VTLKVGELVAFIRADGTQFDRQVDSSGQKFSRLGSTIAAGTKAIAGSMVAVTAAGVGLGAAVFKIGADYNRLQQSSRAALTTLLGSAEAANAQMDKLDAFAKTSPFAKQVFITAQQQLLGFGVTADKVLPTLDAIQNAVAAVGGSNEEVSRVTYALAQMQGQGKLTGETLNQLGQYGIDAATILGQQLGETGQEIRRLASKPGGIPVDEVWDPLVTGLMQRFGGATDNIKQQMDGALDRIKGAWRDVGSILAAPFIDPKGGGRAVEWANKVADGLRALEQKAKPAVDLLVGRFAPGLDQVSVQLDRARAAVNRLDLSQLNRQLDTVAKHGPLVAAAGGALVAFGTGSIPVLGRLLPALNPVVGAVVGLVAATPSLRAAGADLVTGLGPAVPVLERIGKALVDAAVAAIDELAPAAGELLGALGPVVVLLVQQLAPALVATIGATTPLVGVLADVVSWLGQLPGPVLAGAAAFGVAAAVLPRMVAGLQGAAASAAAAGGALKAAFIGNPVTLAIMAIATAVGIFVTRQAEAEQRVADLTSTLDQQTAAITENTRAHVYNRLETDGVIAKAKELGLSLDRVVDAAVGGRRATDSLTEGYENAAAKTRELARGGLGAFAEGTAEATRKSMLYKDVLVAVGGVSDDVAESQQRVKDQVEAGIGVTEGATRAVRTQEEALRDLVDAQKAASGAAISVREAQIRATESQEAANEAIKEGVRITREGTGAVDLNAESTRLADKALLDLVASQGTLTDSMRKNNAGAGELDRTVRQQRDAFVQTAQQMGYTRDEADKLAAAYGLIPNNVITKITAEAEAAQAVIDRFITVNDGRRIRVTVDTAAGNTYNYAPGNKFVMSAQHDGAIVKAFAGGGFHGLTPMDAVAQMVPPNTWRVVGDRVRDTEAYIPLDGSVRSLAILDQAAKHLGQRVIPMANGGMAGRPAPVNVTMPPLGDIVAAFSPAQFAELVDAISGRARAEATGAVRTARVWGQPR